MTVVPFPLSFIFQQNQIPEPEWRLPSFWRPFWLWLWLRLRLRKRLWKQPPLGNGKGILAAAGRWCFLIWHQGPQAESSLRGSGNGSCWTRRWIYYMKDRVLHLGARQCSPYSLYTVVKDYINKLYRNFKTFAKETSVVSPLSLMNS